MPKQNQRIALPPDFADDLRRVFRQSDSKTFNGFALKLLHCALVAREPPGTIKPLPVPWQCLRVAVQHGLAQEARKLMRDHGINQQTVAKAMNLSDGRISQLLRYPREPRASELLATVTKLAAEAERNPKAPTKPEFQRLADDVQAYLDGALGRGEAGVLVAPVGTDGSVEAVVWLTTIDQEVTLGLGAGVPFSSLLDKCTEALAKNPWS